MVKPKKHLGQHFLTDQHSAERTAQLINKCNTTNVLEIGPGKGILTKFLLKQPNKIIHAIEIDLESATFLQDQNLLQKPFLMEGDFLNLNLTQLFKGDFILIIFATLKNDYLIQCY